MAEAKELQRKHEEPNLGYMRLSRTTFSKTRTFQVFASLIFCIRKLAKLKFVYI